MIKINIQIVRKAKLLSFLLCTVFILAGLFTHYVQAAEDVPGQIASAKKAGISEFNQATMLEDAVNKGDLPPLEERLPEDPVVVNVVEEIGQYGGTWNRMHGDDGMGPWLMTNYYEPLIRWNRKATDFLPNLVREWEWNEEKTEVVVNFVEGIKWSDGDPLTVDDFLFWWEDLVLDDRFPYTTPFYTRTDGEPMKVEKIDDFTLKVSFTAPNPLFLKQFGRGFYNSAWFLVPSHYLKQFHPGYNSELEDGDVQELQDHYDNRHQYPDMPTISAWRTVEFQSGKRAVFERNPYYWKVDAQGNQLPYIDKVISRKYDDPEMLILKTIEGEVNFQVRSYPLKDIPLLYEKSEDGDYRIINWDMGNYTWPQVFPGYNYPEEEIRDLMWNKKFRRALSYAIDREKINEVVFMGLGTPRQFSLSKRTPVLSTPEGRELYEEWASSYADFNPDKARQLLDEIGMVDQDGDGFRELPSGEQFTLTATTASDSGSYWALTRDALTFIEQTWEEVGINTEINPIPSEALITKRLDGELMCYIRGYGAAWDLLSAAATWTPVQYTDWTLAPQFARYYQTGGEDGIKPPEGSAFKKLQDYYDKALRTEDQEEINEILLKAYRLHIDEGPLTIGVAGDHPKPIVASNKFRNVPDFGIEGPWDLGYPGATNPEQYFIKQ